MKKVLSLILSAAILISFPNIALASNREPYEYILPMEYDKIEICSLPGSSLIITAYDKNGKCALYSRDGKKLSEDYDRIYSFDTYNMVTYAARGNTGYILNADGDVCGTFDKPVISVSDYVLVDLSDNTDGRPIHYYDGNFGVYNYAGEELAVFPYEKFRPSRTSSFGLSFSGSMLIYRENYKYGAIDGSFRTVIEPIFDAIYPFSDSGWITVAVLNGKYGLIDKTGNTVADFIYDYIEPMYFDGEICAYKVVQGNLYGALSAKDGSVIKELDDKEPRQIYPNYSLIEVSILNTADNNNEHPLLCGLMDFHQNTVIPVCNTDIYNISEGMICARKLNGLCGYYDISGNEVTEFKYNIVSPFSDGLAFASKFDGENQICEVINNEGSPVFNAENWSGGFFGGIAFIGSGKFIDKTGKVIINNPEWKEIKNVSYYDTTKDGTFIVSDGNACGLIRYTPKAEEAAWSSEYIDFPNTKAFEKAKYGYVFTTGNNEKIYLDESGNPTDNAVSVTGFNTFFNQGKTELRDNQNNVFAKFDTDGTDVHEYENYICTVSREENSSDKTLRIYRKADGELTLETGYDNFLNSEYEYACPNKNGHFVFQNGGGLFGIADVYGNITLQPQYEHIFMLGDANFKALKDGKWKVIDSSGKESDYTYTEEPVKYYNCPKYTVLKKDNETKILGENNELIINIGDRTIKDIPCDSAVILCDKDPGRQGILGMDGKTILPFDKQEITYLGKNVFKVTGNTEGDFLIRTDGKILAANCMYITEIGDNGYIGISQNGFEGYIGTDGRTLLTLKKGFYVAGTFSEGLAPIVSEPIYSRYGKTSYINETGDIMLASEDETWYSGSDFKNGIAIVGVGLGKAGITHTRLIRCVYDTPSDWAKKAVETAKSSGLLLENQQKRYRKNITREDFCEIAYELPAVKNALINTPANYTAFSDTDNEKVLAMYSLGIIKGVGAGSFAPDRYITREEAAAILEKIYFLSEKQKPVSDYRYEDDNSISPWAKDAVYLMRDTGIMYGVSESAFSPALAFTTEQAIATIVRLSDIK